MTMKGGERLGPYEILSPLGAGGMGEVYRARDTRLDRSVAIKVLPQGSAGDEELRRRFEREARTVSGLNHPHICTLHDVGREGEVDYLVMELIEGETLAERLKRGPLSRDEVFRFGIQIAEGLASAHRHGVVHRDLKPGNVMLTRSGAKLLDFGLARPGTGSGSSDADDLSALPTHNQTLTGKGAILGTFQYMAPEQLEGREVDARTDVFALGAVLYEMATGRRAFAGSSQASLISAIMSADPPPMAVAEPLAPSPLERLVRTCLAKDPEKRWQSALDVARALEWASEPGPAPPLSADGGRPRGRERVAWAVAGLATLAAAVVVSMGWTRALPPAAPVRFEIASPEGLPVVGSPRISPDGRHVAFDATDEAGVRQLWVRPLSALRARPLPGTEGAGRPFWSPDSRQLAFFADGRLRKIPISGGPAQTICDAPSGADGSWSDDGVILYDGTDDDPIMRVAASGGTPSPFVTPEAEGGAQVGWPQFLPGRREFLYVAFGSDAPRLRFGSLDGAEGKTVLNGESRVEYAPPGHLLYVRENTLVAQGFDASTGRTTGEPVSLAEGLGMDSVGLAHFSASRNGALVYRSGDAGGAQLTWMGPGAADRRPEGDALAVEAMDLSPDGRWLALELGGVEDSHDDLWVRDLTRGVTSRLTFAGGQGPVWSPDGNRVAFAHGRTSAHDVAVLEIAGSGEPEIVLAGEHDEHPSSWSPDGRFLLYDVRHPDRGVDISVLTIADGESRPFLTSTFTEAAARFSPDGRSVAYMSNETGRFEIYVQPFPGPGRKRQISTEGGSDPRWSPDGRALYYLDETARNLMRVAVRAGDGFDAGVPERLFPVQLLARRDLSRYLVHPDGERFLVMGSLGGEGTPPATVVLNWSAEPDP